MRRLHHSMIVIKVMWDAPTLVLRTMVTSTRIRRPMPSRARKLMRPHSQCRTQAQRSSFIQT